MSFLVFFSVLFGGISLRTIYDKGILLHGSLDWSFLSLTLLHPERILLHSETPKLFTILDFLSAVGLSGVRFSGSVL